MEDNFDNFGIKKLTKNERLALLFADESKRRAEYDKAFVDMIEEMKEEGKVENWDLTKQNSPDDQRGVDAWVKIGDEDIPVNLKGRKTSSTDMKRVRELQNQGVIILRSVTKKGRVIKTPEMLRASFNRLLSEREAKRNDSYLKRY